MFKYILVPATGAETDAPVFATALSVAHLSAGHLVFFHVRPDTQRVLTALSSSADMGGNISYEGIVEGLEQRANERQRKADHAFRDFCARESVAISGARSSDKPSAEWRLEIGDEALGLGSHGRAADLVVMGRLRDGEAVARDLLEAALMDTGRPVLIAPATARNRLIGTVVIAWKDTPESARAVAAARPFIELADRVIIISVEEGFELAERSSERVCEALSWHNPNTSLRHLVPNDRPVAETLLAEAAALNADLLVMGGYGHSRTHERIFGGLTRHVLNQADLPVLIMH